MMRLQTHCGKNPWMLTALLLGALLLIQHPTLSVLAQDFDIPAFTGRDPDEHPRLAPCSSFEDRYDTLLFRDTNLEEWPDIYHDQVNRVVEEYFEIGEVACDAEDYDALLEPGGELLNLAAALPTWNDPKVPLSRLDTARVLLEYLRIYECALFEFDIFREFDTMREEDRIRGDINVAVEYWMYELAIDSSERYDIIKKEREIARRALHRVLSLIGAYDRLRPLEAELRCMQRFSLDMRNITALTAETAACMPPRIWQADDSLRDFAE